MIQQIPPSQADSSGRRTVLPTERTYAAWVKTGLKALAAGLGAKKVLGGVLPEWRILSALVLFEAFSFVAAVWQEVWSCAPPPKLGVKRVPAPHCVGLPWGFDWGLVRSYRRRVVGYSTCVELLPEAGSG
ncbi:DUF202 domain-containing protein [Teichococcus vastitatis]|uniref:DUF202 domain-containing protein n=1 Tax=Teichococcus vastitatis TaxID=2307076 RepID=UPI0013002EB6|nr:DUF202 domain-containing protein [Pseudoroseomonas vastitatis]